jgi:hypothetical protein
MHGGVEGSESAFTSLSIQNEGSRINHYVDFLCHPDREDVHVVFSPAGPPLLLSAPDPNPIAQKKYHEANNLHL